MKSAPYASTTRRRLLTSVGAALPALAAGGALISISKAHAADTVEVKEQLDWLPGKTILGDIVAQAQGYFEEEGLSLTITPGGPSVNGVASVAAGSAMVGSLSSSPALMLARAGGLPVKCFAVGYQKHPFAYFSLPRNPIRTPEDMRGKRIGTPQVSLVLLKALLAKYNIPESDVKIVILGGEPGPLLSGQVDAISNWTTDYRLVAPLGPDRIALKLWDAGIRLYAGPYYATDNTIQERPDVLARFLKAVARGWAFTHANPEKAIEILVKTYPTLDYTTEIAAIKVALPYVFTDETAQHGWGTMKRENWEAQLAIYDNLGQFNGRRKPSVDEVMTLTILDMTADARPKIG